MDIDIDIDIDVQYLYIKIYSIDKEISISIFMLPFQYIRYIDNIYLYTENGKWMFVCRGRQTINDNQRLLFHQTCPSTVQYGLLPLSLHLSNKQEEG
jgi:hypothetical protein